MLYSNYSNIYRKEYKYDGKGTISARLEVVITDLVDTRNVGMYDVYVLTRTTCNLVYQEVAMQTSECHLTYNI